MSLPADAKPDLVVTVTAVSAFDQIQAEVLTLSPLLVDISLKMARTSIESRSNFPSTTPPITTRPVQA
jgi:hypothetical protein